MKRAILTIGILILVLPAYASTIFYEGFTAYSPGELHGQNGGTGFSNAWTAVAANTQVVSPATALAYTVPGGGSVSGGSSALQLTGDNEAQVARTLSASQTGDVFFSFLFRQNAGTIDTYDVTSFWFDNDATNANGQTLLPSIGARGNQGTGTSPEDFFSRVSSNAPVYSTAALASTDYFIVGRLFKSGSVNYNRFSLWVNPSFGADATPDATSAFAGTTAAFSRLGIRSFNQDPDDVIYVDEFKAGTTWADVVPAALIIPVPEPTAFALMGVGFIGLLASRRKRSRA